MKKTAIRSTNPTVKYVPLEIEGETYQLAYDFNAIAVAEAECDVNLLYAIQFHNLNARQFRGLLYAALLKSKPDITIAKVSSLITAGNLDRISEALVQAWAASMPKKADEENPLAPEPSLAAAS